MSDGEQLWTAVAQLLRAQVSEAVWLSTFQLVTEVDDPPGGDRVLHLHTPNNLTAANAF